MFKQRFDVEHAVFAAQRCESGKRTSQSECQVGKLVSAFARERVLAIIASFGANLLVAAGWR